MTTQDGTEAKVSAGLIRFPNVKRIKYDSRNYRNFETDRDGETGLIIRWNGL
jgi:hypothetical protein